MGRKHCGKKEKLLVTSNFSFSNSVFKRLELQTRKNQGLFGKGLRAFTYDRINLSEKLKFVLGRVENREGKGENAGYQDFLRFPQCFLKASLSRSGKGLTLYHATNLKN